MSRWTEENPLKIFVTVGTNHNNFKRMLDIVDSCLEILPVPYVINVQYGTSTPYVLKPHQKGNSQSMFPREETQKLVKEADLVFSHCGIGSIYNALVSNRPTVIIPRLHKFDEFSDDHQLQIAQEIKNNPLILMVAEQVDKDAFLQFFAEKVPQPSEDVDLRNPHLAEFIKSRLIEPNATNKDVLLIASAGGHMTQALCLMPAVGRFHLVTSLDTGLDVGAQSYHLIEDTQFSAWIHFKNFFKVFKILRKVKPAAIFSTGGPICLPFALAAKLFKIKFVYLDTLSRVEDLSNTARFLYKNKLASEIYVQWDHHTKKYPGLTCHGKTFDICGENQR